jgi:hypothetical protein
MQSTISRHLGSSSLHLMRARRTRALPWHHALLLATALSVAPPGTAAFSTTAPSSYYYEYQSLKRRRAPSLTPWTSRPMSLSSSSTPSDNEAEDDNDDDSNSNLSPRERILKRSPKEDHEIIETTLQWVRGAVIGLNMCPFAETPYKANRMHLEVIHEGSSNQVEIMARVLAECLVRRSKPGTSLMICPTLYPTNFNKFLEVVNMLTEGVLVDQELVEDVQIAPFHPLFEFEGSGADGVDNYTNRSPYPIFHILREEEVSQAVDLLQGDASKVWRRNVQFLERLDEELDNRNQLEQLLRTGKEPEDTAVRETVQAVLRELKKKNPNNE